VEEIPAGGKKKAKKEDMKESWYTEKPEQAKLMDKSGKKETGFLYMRARREVKVIGQIQIKGIDIERK
jgi:hypothetical protein